jgi:hypothetical protein
MATQTPGTPLSDSSDRDVDSAVSAAEPATASSRKGDHSVRAVAALLAIGLIATIVVVALRTRGSNQATVTAAAVPPAAALVHGAPRGSSAYVGAAAPAAAKLFGKWRGAPVTFADDCLSTASWHEIAAPDWWLQRWHAGGLPLVLGVPMLPDNRSATIHKGALGKYNRYFRELALDLVRNGDAHASLRLGWEMTGGWYRWSAQPNPAAWISYYRKIVTTMRAVRGAHFSFDWNPNLGDSGMAAAAAYPGNKYVDIIGMDVYDWKWSDPGASPATRWSWILSQPSGMNWLSNFAAAHHKPVALPEWALAARRTNAHGGGGDDPYFIRHLLGWARSHHAVYEAYFNNGTDALSNYPRAARAYRHFQRSHRH